MPHVDVVIFLEDVAATILKEVAMAAVTNEVTSPTSRGIVFLPASFMGRAIIRLSSAIRGFIQPTWGREERQHSKFIWCRLKLLH
jgi:hypothetical protein